MPLIYTPVLWPSAELFENLSEVVDSGESSDRPFQVTGVRMRPDAVEAGDLFVARGRSSIAAACRAAADRGAIGVLVASGTSDEIDSHLHRVVVKDHAKAIETLARARRSAFEGELLAVVGRDHLAEAMLIGELLGQQDLGYVADGWLEEGLLNLGPQPKFAVFHLPGISPQLGTTEWLAPTGLLILDPKDVDAGALQALIEGCAHRMRVVLVGPDTAELAAVAEKAGAEVLRAGRDGSMDLHVGEVRTEKGVTIVPIAGKRTVEVRLETRNPAVDRCLAAVAGVVAGGGDAGKASFALGVLSVAAASAERLQLEQLSGTTTAMVTPEQLEAAAAPVPGPEIDDEIRAELGRYVFAAVDGESPSLSDAATRAIEPAAGSIYFSLREKGTRLREFWAEGSTAVESLREGLRQLREVMGEEAKRADGIELVLTHGYRPEDLKSQRGRSRLQANVHRGIRGVEFKHGGTTMRVSPTYIVSTNRDTPKLIQQFCQQRGLTENRFAAEAECRSFDSTQLWIERGAAGETPRTYPLFRGNRLIEVESIDKAAVEGLERDLGDFIAKSVHKDGRMTYLYYPSRGTEDLDRNNMIRQWMATCALARTARFRNNDKKLFDLAENNIRYNLRKFYSTSGKLGLIEYSGKVKLGAVALAALAIFEHPKRSQFKRVESKLHAMIEHLWHEDGSFTTFFKPAGRNDVQNFYPGEAQLARAFVLEDKPDDELLARFMASFRYYRDWHFENRNPAFIPWHVQAYYKIWKMTRDDDLREFIYTTSDWLLGMQQGTEVLYPDCIGRFHDPKRPNFGPPHASSTGVYMEGLIDAFELARELGDVERKERYRLAIVNGLRSLKQLMFKGDDDMFYVRRKDYLLGGVRTTVYNNVVRIDNVQHNQMAILKILKAFEPEDFSHLPRS